jgi:atypical dual specificity phosphatase
MREAAMSLRGFGLSFGDRTVLQDLALDLSPAHMSVLVGPAGGGKSTLLRTLSGLNDAHPSLSTWGTIRIGDIEFSGGGAGAVPKEKRPSLVMQNARFFMDSVRENLVSALPNRSDLDQRAQTRLVCELLESHGLDELIHHLDSDVMGFPLSVQRKLCIIRALVADPAILFADEPTAGLHDDDATEIVAMLRVQARKRAVLFVTHNQKFAKFAGGTTLLLAGGRIAESAPTTDFFSQPRSEHGRQFLRTGGCITSSPDTPAEDLDEAIAPVPTPPAGRPRSRSVGPRGFFWIVPGRLGGLPRPGIIDHLDHDLDGLARLGVSVLVTLEETPTVPPEILSARRIQPLHFPIDDMKVPTVDAALDLCRRVQGWMDGGEVVALHCRAGLGRTGTMLACQLIFAGESARGALEAVRHINPKCIQSEIQVDFLRSLEMARGSASRPAPVRAIAVNHPQRD